jgi:hypothetical protein
MPRRVVPGHESEVIQEAVVQMNLQIATPGLRNLAVPVVSSLINDQWVSRQIVVDFLTGIYNPLDAPGRQALLFGAADVGAFIDQRIPVIPLADRHGAGPNATFSPNGFAQLVAGLGGAYGQDLQALFDANARQRFINFLAQAHADRRAMRDTNADDFNQNASDPRISGAFLANQEKVAYNKIFGGEAPQSVMVNTHNYSPADARAIGKRSLREAHAMPLSANRNQKQRMDDLVRMNPANANDTPDMRKARYNASNKLSVNMYNMNRTPAQRKRDAFVPAR